MPSPESASVSGAPTQYDIVRMSAYAAGRKEAWDELLAELTQYALHSPITERSGSQEIADYLWVIIVEWQEKRPR
jgi:sugar-specific transcriptional regulator TrmB